MTKTVSAAELSARIGSGGELALIDAREEGDFGRRHILLCANIPLSHLELRAADAIPRKAAPVVFCDNGGGEAARAAARLAAFGYTDVAVLDGGMDAWAAEGLELFSGLNVPSKAFGEFVEHACGTPSVSADELKAMMDSGEDLVVLDSRPMDEFRAMSIPTGIDMPGAELVLRVQEAAPDPATTVVVNCAGRTRSIIGAQSLIDAGVPNRVAALRNGTMGWHLAGYELERGQERAAPEPSADGLRIARARAGAAAARFGVERIDAATLDAWRAEAAERTLYILDVGTAEEFAAGHIADSRHAPGGQLVQATDAHVAVQGARVVLVDDLAVRALMTAGWLVQLGWCKPYVLDSGLDGQAILRGPRAAPAFGLGPGGAAGITPREALAAQAAGATLVDLQRSLDHRRRRPRGARFGIRARLAGDLRAAGVAGPVVLASPDGALAELAAADLAAAGRDARFVAGGNAAWEAAGLPLDEGEAGMEPVSALEDAYLRAYDRSDPAEAERAMNEYLEWEIALVEQIGRPGGIAFRTRPAA